MRSFPATSLVLFFIALFPFATQAQTFKFNELTTSFASASYPNSVFDLLEGKGFTRIDKQYPDFCERVVYYFNRAGKPTMFVNPKNCNRTFDHELYPLKVKNELELQFQRSNRASFDYLTGLIKKQCQPLPLENVSNSDEKSTVKAYRHPATSTTFLIKTTDKVCFIYLLN